jgi:D-aminopeptidase
VLVQTNFGGVLTINGAPIGRELGQFSFAGQLAEPHEEDPKDDGSIMIVVATDAPLTARNLDRLSRRAMMGLARTGSFAHNGSGDYVIAFSTAKSVRRPRSSTEPQPMEALANPSMSPLFAATAEATEEAVFNALFKATTVASKRGTLEAIPIDAVEKLLAKYQALNWDTKLAP